VSKHLIHALQNLYWCSTSYWQSYTKESVYLFAAWFLQLDMST